MEQIVFIYFVHQLLNNMIYIQIIIKCFLRIERFLFALEKQF